MWDPGPTLIFGSLSLEILPLGRREVGFRAKSSQMSMWDRGPTSRPAPPWPARRSRKVFVGTSKLKVRYRFSSVTEVPLVTMLGAIVAAGVLGSAGDAAAFMLGAIIAAGVLG